MTTPFPADPPRARPWFPAAVSAALAVLLYGVTLAGTYAYDDVAIVRDDLRVHSPARWGQLWTHDYWDGGGVDNLYRPLVSTSYAVEWFLHGDRPWAFHLVNVLLHAATAAAVAELTRRCTGRPAAGTVAGLLFAAHPVHAEAVANLVGRAESAVALALVGSLVLLARRPLHRGRATAVIACGIAALLCKEQGLLAPFLWAGLIAIVWRRPVRPAERPVLRTAGGAAVWIWAGCMLVRERFLKFEWDRSFLEWAAQPMVRTAGLDRLTLPIALLGRYVRLLAWPHPLSPDYGGAVIGSSTSASDPYLWIGIITLIAWLGLAVWAWRRRAGFGLFCLLAMAASYLPVGNTFTIIGTIFAERLIYLPSAFAAMAVGAAAMSLSPRVRTAMLILVLLPMSFATVRAASEWNRPRDLFARALADYPGSVQLHLLVAQIAGEDHRPLDRAAVLDDACRRFPDYWQCWGARARAAADDHQFPQAEAFLQTGMDQAFNVGLQRSRNYLSEREAEAHWTPTSTRPTAGR